MPERDYMGANSYLDDIDGDDDYDDDYDNGDGDDDDDDDDEQEVLTGQDTTDTAKMVDTQEKVVPKESKSQLIARTRRILRNRNLYKESETFLAEATAEGVDTYEDALAIARTYIPEI